VSPADEDAAEAELCVVEVGAMSVGDGGSGDDQVVLGSRLARLTGLGPVVARLAPRPESGIVEHMAIQRMEHVGIVFLDLAAATEFFVELGLVLQGEGPVEGRWVDRVVGLEGVRADIAIMQTPDGNGRLELTKFHSPSNQGDNRHAPANTPGIRHVAFAVEDIDAVVAGLRARGAELVGELERYEDSYRLCYVRGPEGIIIELAEQIG
jgi:catechol 2,3-dioxygenase-like lactoylglutathione lyase family enzyme